MPACVVKWCRSHTDTKNSGVTFHNFPVNNNQWWKWIEAVRLERGEANWMPSKSSIHFQHEDLCLPFNGRCRVKKTAVPVCTMVNYSPASSSSLDKCQTTMEPPSNASGDVKIQNNPCTTTTSSTSLNGDPNEQSPSSSVINTETTILELSEASSGPSSPNTSLSQMPAETEILFLIDQPLSDETFKLPTTSLPTRKKRRISGDSDQQPFHRITRLEGILRRKQIVIKNQTKNIRLLREKVKRLEERNEYLKDIIKDLFT